MEARICTLCTKVDIPSRKLQQRNEHDYDRRVPETPEIRPQNLALVTRTQLTATKNIEASSLATATYKKGLWRTIGRFRIINVQLHTVIIEENGVSK